MSIKATIFQQFEELTGASTKPGPPLSDETVLLDSGLDSLRLAILVTRLEDSLGVDPFTDSDINTPPVTLGDFVRLYEHAAPAD